ncbi:hypothetical protein H0H93_005955, partial [Arthromyces matolae]
AAFVVIHATISVALNASEPNVLQGRDVHQVPKLERLYKRTGPNRLPLDELPASSQHLNRRAVDEDIDGRLLSRANGQ